MMIVNGQRLLMAAPMKDMLDHKARGPLSSHGLSEAGYDIRLKQEVVFSNVDREIYINGGFSKGCCFWIDGASHVGRFALASAVEEFQMPSNLVGIVHDKSTWARLGLSVFNTVIEPGWRGFLTLELVYHGNGRLAIPAGSGIAQVVFHETVEQAEYDGKYQNQPDRPVEARHDN